MLLNRTCCIDCLLGNIKLLEFTARAVIYVDVVTQNVWDRLRNRNNIEFNQTFVALFRQTCWECLFILFVCLCISRCPALSPQSDNTECLSLSRRRKKKSAHTKTGELLKLGLLSFLRVLSSNLSLLFLSNMTEENDLGQAGKDALWLQVTFIRKLRSNKNVWIYPSGQQNRGGSDNTNIKKVLIVKIRS